MNKCLIKDLDFAKDYLSLNDNQLCNILDISRSSLNSLRKNENEISSIQYERIYSFLYSKGIKINNLKSQIYKDSENKNQTILFHGAKKEIVGKIDLKHSKDGNDFGKGFYLGTDLNQAATFVCGSNSSSVYICEYRNNKDLKKKIYDVDEDWMLTIAYYRGRLTNYLGSKRLQRLIEDVKKSDILIAPIADNNMYQIIDDFIKGNITNLQCINSLSASDLGKQYVFLTSKAINNLTIKERCYMCDDERKYYENIKKENNESGRQKVKYIMREYAGKGKYIEELL